MSAPAQAPIKTAVDPTVRATNLLLKVCYKAQPAAAATIEYGISATTTRVTIRAIRKGPAQGCYLLQLRNF